MPLPSTQVQETERLMEDEAGWVALPAQEREDREGALRQAQRVLGSDFYLASVLIKTMQYTSVGAHNDSGCLFLVIFSIIFSSL